MTGAAIVGAGASLFGAYSSSKASGAAADAASDATNASAAASAAQLAFQKEQQARWDEVFGPTQDILADYYNHLNPDDVAATNVTNMQKAYQSTQVQLDKQLAQRGIGESGLAASMSQNLMYQNEMGKAEAKVLAPQQVAQQQANFLGLGMGASGALNAGMSSAYSNQINSANNAYNAATIQQLQANQSFGSSIGALGSIAGQVASTYSTPTVNTNYNSYSYLPSLPVSTSGYTPQ